MSAKSATSPTFLDLREAPHGVGITLHEANEQRRLCIQLTWVFEPDEALIE